MTVVYLDRVLLLNLLVDYLLLLTTARLAGIPLRRGRLALCAAVGALYAGAVFLPGLSWLSHPLCRTAGGAAMALAAWRREAHPWRLTALFFLLAGGLGGLVLALGLASGSVAAYVGRLYRAEISWPVLLGAALGFFGLLHLVFRQAARHGGGEIMDATISIGGQSRAVRVLHDTGNTLRSPVTGQPVLVLEQTSLGGLLPPEVERIVVQSAALLQHRSPGGTAAGSLQRQRADRRHYISPDAGGPVAGAGQRRRRVSGPVGRNGEGEA